MMEPSEERMFVGRKPATFHDSSGTWTEATWWDLAPFIVLTAVFGVFGGLGVYQACQCCAWAFRHLM